MDELITSIGVPGIILLLVFREVLNYKFKQKNGGNSIAITRNEFERHKGSVQYKDNCEQIVKRIDASIENQEKRFNKIDENFEDVKSLIRNGGK